MPQLFVATNGLSVWQSDDLGQTIGRMGSGANLYSGSQVWALASHPADAEHVYAGTDSGLHRLDRKTMQWTHMPSPMDGERLVTAIALAPGNPQVMLCGTQPSALYRSSDGGQTWARIETAMRRFTTSGFYGSKTQGFAAADEEADESARVHHWTRVTQILFDPADNERLWAGVEIDGAWTSKDGGRHWERVTDGLKTDDIHGYAMERAGGPLFATTNAGLHVSRDQGRSWSFRAIESPWQYTRSIVARPDGSGVMFMTNGNGPPGTGGRLFRSRDQGETWQETALPGKVESSLYFLAANPADPSLLFAAATLGQLWRSRDGGETWDLLPARLPEIRALLWVP
jgi:photosystem II stability/assembly factor-like uncharacterized protein